MTQPDLHRQIAVALRVAAYDCTEVGDCQLTDLECLTQHPVQIAAWQHSEIASVYGDVDVLAAVAAEAVQPLLDQLRKDLDTAHAELATYHDRFAPGCGCAACRTHRKPAADRLTPR